MKHEESILQRQCVRWFRLQYPKHTLFAVPNGGARSKVEAAIMNGEGVLAGVADLFLMCAGRDLHGLFVELKSQAGKLSPTQKEFAQKAMAAGYGCVVVRSLDEFMKWINWYINTNN